jgi:transcriptional regulator with XRE-family HTH domain
MSSRKPNLPLRARRALVKLGGDIRDARRRRRIPVRVMAERALISPTTLTKIERGDPGTAIGFYASVLFVLGLEQRLGELVDVSTDTLGLSLAERDLPDRVRWPKGGSGSSEEPDAT